MFGFTDFAKSLHTTIDISPLNKRLLQAAESIRTKRKQWEEALDFQERETIERYLNLPIEQRKVIREVINAFSQVFDQAHTELKP